MSYKLSIVVPCYNEEKNIPLVFEKFAEAIKRPDIQVVMVNNWSMDNSAQLLKELAQKHSFAKIVTVEKNQWYGFGILSGLREAEGEYIGWTHADMQTDPKDVLKALDSIEAAGNPKDIFVKGIRRGRPLFDQFFSNGMGIFESVYMMTPLREVNAQPNVFHKSFFASREEPPYDFALDLYVLYMAHQKKLTIVRFDVMFPPRIHGESTWNTGLKAKWKFIKRTLNFSVELKKRLRK